MHIKKLHDQINKQRELKNLPPLSEAEYLAQITTLQLENKIKVENGEVSPAK